MSHWVDVGPVPTPEQNLRDKVSWLARPSAGGGVDPTQWGLSVGMKVSPKEIHRCLQDKKEGLLGGGGKGENM